LNVAPLLGFRGRHDVPARKSLVHTSVQLCCSTAKTPPSAAGATIHPLSGDPTHLVEFAGVVLPHDGHRGHAFASDVCPVAFPYRPTEQPPVHASASAVRPESAPHFAMLHAVQTGAAPRESFHEPAGQTPAVAFRHRAPSHMDPAAQSDAASGHALGASSPSATQQQIRASAVDPAPAQKEDDDERR
jgi:hypothetical protein